MLEVRLFVASLVARQEGDGVRYVAVRQRNLQARGCCNAGGDAGDDFDVNARRAKRVELFAATAENQRIATFQTNNGLPGKRALDQQRVDLILRGAVLTF